MQYKDLRPTPVQRLVWILPYLSLLSILHLRTSTLSVEYPRALAENEWAGPIFSLTDNATSSRWNKILDVQEPYSMSQIETRSESGCWRKCPNQRRNHIVVNFNRQAGLNDRFYIIERMANIAGYLCANLHIPSPSAWLSIGHNRGVPLSMNVKWSDYQNWSWKMPDVRGQPVINPLYKLDNQTSSIVMSKFESSQLYIVGNLLKRNAPPHEQKWYSTMEIPQHPQHHLLANPTNALDQILQLNDMVDDQWKLWGNGANGSDIGEFLWEVPIDPYHMKVFDDQIRVAMAQRNQSIPPSFPENFPRRIEGCQYISKSPSKHVKEVVRRVWNDIFEPNATMGFFHIRRGDAMAQCNTTIPKLHSYLDCSFANTTKYGDIKMLVATDETDDTYINQLKSTLETLYSHVKMVHLDPLVEKHVEALAREKRRAGSAADFVNNFFMFQVENVIRYKRAAFVISQRRFDCNDCDILSRWHSVNWAGSRQE
jgi:hypothetical protein